MGQIIIWTVDAGISGPTEMGIDCIIGVSVAKHIQVWFIKYFDTKPSSLHPSFGVLSSVLFAALCTHCDWLYSFN